MTATRQHPRPALVPELNITSLPASLAFWRDLLGFRILYDRPEQGFAAIERDGVEFMLEEYDTGPAERRGIWDTGAREKPYGRGINFEIMVKDVGLLIDAVRQASWPIFFGPEERWYRINGSEETGVHQFLVQDPDGYLLRLSQSLGRRPLASA
jgi:catechol 2,3-dioxygenase-like lactoylglutathione lyase family enzyme